MSLMMISQIMILVSISFWGVSKLIDTTLEILELAAIKISLPKLQKTKNHAESLAAKRDSIPIINTRA